MEEGASANFTKMAEVDSANTPKNRAKYEKKRDFIIYLSPFFVATESVASASR